MDKRMPCPLCGGGHLTPRTEESVSEYRGQKGSVILHFAECDVCGSEITGDDDGRANKRAVMQFRKQVDGLLTGDEIRAIREKYRLTQVQAAKLFGGGPVAFSKYEHDDVSHSDAMDNLLRLVRRSEEAFWELVAEKRMTDLLQRRHVHKVYKFGGEVVLLARQNDDEGHFHRTKRTSYLTEPRSTRLTQPTWTQ